MILKTDLKKNFNYINRNLCKHHLGTMRAKSYEKASVIKNKLLTVSCSSYVEALFLENC